MIKTIFLSEIDENIKDSHQIKRKRGIINGYQDNEVIVKCHETGETLFKGTNKVLIAGSDFTASKWFGLKPPIETVTYNQALGLDKTKSGEEYGEYGYREDYLVQLFCVGISGCGLEASQVYSVERDKWIAPEDLLPFRYQAAAKDLTASMRDKYFGRCAKGDKVAYYFKTFDGIPEWKRQYTDGTPIDENIYLSERKDDIEIFVESKMSITKDDLRDYFKATTGIQTAKVNTLSLCNAYKEEIDGYVYYQSIRPTTRLNFPNESLIDLSKGVDIIYHTYF